MREEREKCIFVGETPKGEFASKMVAQTIQYFFLPLDKYLNFFSPSSEVASAFNFYHIMMKINIVLDEKRNIYLYYFFLIKLISWSNDEMLKLSLDLCGGCMGFTAKFFSISVYLNFFPNKMLVKKIWRKKSVTPKHQECNKLQIQERKFTLWI